MSGVNSVEGPGGFFNVTVCTKSSGVNSVEGPGDFLVSLCHSVTRCHCLTLSLGVQRCLELTP